MRTEQDWVELAGGRLRGVTRGSGPRRIFLPALGGSFEVYEALVDRLAQRSRLTVLEPFGTAASDDPAGVPSTESLAEAIVEAIDALSIDRFDLVGLSLGGMVAQHVAGLAGDRTRSLVLASTVVRGLRGALEGDVRHLAMARCLLEPSREQAALCLAEGVLEGRPGDSVEDAVRAHPLGRRALLWLMAAGARHDGSAALARYAGPARILSGALDTILPPDTQARLFEHLPQARQVVIDAAGHDLGLEAPQQMARECDALAQLSPDEREPGGARRNNRGAMARHDRRRS